VECSLEERKIKATESGKAAAKMPLDPTWVYAVNLAKREFPSVGGHIVAIAALRSAQHKIFLDAPHVGDHPWKAFGHPTSDHITELNALYTYERMRVSVKDEALLNNWCNHSLLDRQAMEAVIEVRDDCFEKLGGSQKWDDGFDASSDEEIRRVLARSLFRHTAFSKKRADVLTYHTVHGNWAGVLHPYSNLHQTGPAWIVYDKYTVGKAVPTLSFGTAIDPDWIKVGSRPKHMSHANAAKDLPYFQDDRLKRSVALGTIVQTQVKEALYRARGASAEQASKSWW
jgi:HrpA-like RNA helicase